MGIFEISRLMNTGEDTVDRGSKVHVEVVCDIVITLELIIVTSCNRPTNMIINPISIYSHSNI
jgi:hypothetical protein